MIIRLIGATLLVLLYCSGVNGQVNTTGKPLKVRAIYPSGEEVAASDRITIEFNQNIVALGASMFVDELVPIDIEPAVECEWNWVKLNTLQCELPIDTDLDSATRYTVTIRPGIKALNGQLMSDVYVHVFETTVPSINSGQILSWKSPTEPILRVVFNQVVEIDSLRDRLLMVDSVSGKEISTTICPTVRHLVSRFREDFFGRKQSYQVFDRENCDLDSNHDDSVLILPNEPLAPKAKVSLLLLPGVKGTPGKLLSKDRELVETVVTTFGEFRFLGLTCQDVHGNDLFHAVDQSRENSCSDSSNIWLHFSSRFLQRAISHLVHTEPSTEFSNRRRFNMWRTSQETNSFDYFIRRDFRPNTSYRLYVAATDQEHNEFVSLVPVRDGFGRPLNGPNEVTFRIGRPSPTLYLSQTHFVVDSKNNVEPQLFLENVDDVNLIYDILDEQGVQQAQTKILPSPGEDDTLQVRLFRLRNTIRSLSGVMSGKVVSKPRFEHSKETIEKLFFVQATSYSVFLKLGAVSTLAWVVDLSTGEPIANADVEFYLGTPTNLSEVRETVFSGQTNSEGFVSLPGYETFDPYWDRNHEDLDWDCREGRDCPMYILRVEGTDGIALLPLDHSYTIRGYVYEDDLFESIDHWATTPQDLYLPGDTVHIKGFVRTRRNDIRAIPDEGHFGLCVLGPNREIEVTPLSLNEFGSYHTSITLTNNAELGDYDVSLVYDAQKPVLNPCFDVYRNSKTFEVFGGSFTVFEFKTNPIRVSQTLNAKQYEFGDQFSTTTHGELHAGGPYANAPGQVDVWLESQSPSFQNLPKNEYIISKNREVALSDSLMEEEFELDSEGKNVLTLSSLRSNVYYGDLIVHSSVLSDRGKSVAAYVEAPYFGVDRFVGIRRPERHNSIFGSGWGRVTIGKPWPIEVLVVSKDDEISIGTEVRITVWASQNDSNYYERADLSLRDVEWEEVFDCTLVSTLDPIACDFTPLDNRFYYVIAQVVDSKGNTQISTLLAEALVERERRWDRYKSSTPAELELVCGSQNVTVGDTIRCEVKNYLGNSPTLVTVERTSVIDHWLVQLNPRNPVFEFPVLAHYEPHFELSVLNVFPRSATDNPEDPRYRIGSAQFALDNPRLVPLEITVSTNRDHYRPRDKVKLSISIDENKRTKVSSEFAIAVIDESLLDLITDGSAFFDPTTKTWRMNESSVQTYGLIAALIEEFDRQSPPSLISPEDRSSYSDDEMETVITTGTYMPVSDPDALMDEAERESDPNMRKVDRFIAYWNPSVVSDNGRVKLDFILPDNLTSWRVLVLAVSAEDRFGYAETTFASLKDTEIRPVVPNVVTEGDIFQIGASILNRADQRRRLMVEFQALGDLLKDSETTFKQQMSFEPFERKLVTWDVEAGSLPQSLNLRHPIKSSEIQVFASAGDRREKDALDVRIPVRSNKVRVSSVVYGALAGDKTTIPIGIPSTLATDNGQLDFTLSTNDAVDFDGVFRYAIEYPYSCWEQQLTKAVLAMQYVQLEKRGANHDIQWSDPEGLIRRVLDSAIDYQAYSGGMDYYISADQTSDPYLSVYTAIAFSWLENAGYDTPQEVKQKLLEYLRDYLEDVGELITDSKDLGDKVQIDHVQATVSAVVLHALAVWGELKESELALFSDQMGQMDLFGLSQYLMASITLDPTHSLIPKIFEKIMNQRSLIDGAVEFIESVPRRFSKILHSDTRSLCSVLEAFTKSSDTSGLAIDISELQELSNSVRYARENLPNWRNTQDNVYCTSAMITFFDYVDSDGEDLITSVALRSDDTGISTRLADGWKFDSNVTKLHTQHTLNSQLFGTRGAIDINRQGTGTAFYNVELSYLTKVDDRINRFSGFDVHREYVAYRDKQWHILKPGDEITKGEYVLVNLYLNNRFERYHVVLDDSVPGGLEPVNLKLKTEFFLPYSEWELKEILSQSELYQEFEDAWLWNFRYRELGLQDVRYFANRLRRGKHHVLWLGQAISAGEFTVLPTHVEEMYRPVMFGKSKPWILKVEP